MSTVIFRYLSSGSSEWPPWTFVACSRLFFSTKEGVQSSGIWSLCNIICSFHKTCRALTILKLTVVSVLFYSSVLENCQISNWLVGGFTCTCHITSIFGHQCLSTWFCSCTRLFSVTSAMLHRYSRPFSVHHFSN